MAARVIDLTGSSPPRKKVKTSSNDQAMTQALLAHAINAASPELLRVTLHALGATSKDFAQALSNMLLVTPRIQMSEDADVDANSNDSEEEEEEEDDDDEEHYEAGVITQTTHNMRWQPGPARTRYALCVNCEEEFDVTDNVDDEGCMYHDGELEVDQDMFVDHDENCHGPMDSEDNRRDYPENFIYSCCDEDGQAEGCQTGRHVERS